VYLNGESYPLKKPAYRILRELADARELPPARSLPAEAAALLHEWYLAGYLAPQTGR